MVNLWEKRKGDWCVYVPKCSNIGLKHTSQEYLSILKPISIALQLIFCREINAFISDNVEQWKYLQYIFKDAVELSLQETPQFQSQYKQALSFYSLYAEPTKTKIPINALDLETINELHLNILCL